MEPLLVFLTTPVLGTATWLWLSFLGIVIALLVLDLGILHRDQHEIEMRESLMLYRCTASSISSTHWRWC